MQAEVATTEYNFRPNSKVYNISCGSSTVPYHGSNQVPPHVFVWYQYIVPGGLLDLLCSHFHNKSSNLPKINSRLIQCHSIQDILSTMSSNNDSTPSPPDHFLCPISMVIMSHPVRTETGHIFERRAILEWIYFGKATCPMSRKPLHPSEFVLVTELQREIEEWRRAHNLVQDGDDEDSENEEEENEERPRLGSTKRAALPLQSKILPDRLRELRNKVYQRRDRRLAQFRQQSRGL